MPQVPNTGPPLPAHTAGISAGDTLSGLSATASYRAARLLLLATTGGAYELRVTCAEPIDTPFDRHTSR